MNLPADSNSIADKSNPSVCILDGSNFKGLLYFRRGIDQIGYAWLYPLGQSIDRIHCTTDKVYIGWNRKWGATAR